MKDTFQPGEILATVPIGGGTQYQLCDQPTPAPTKAAKLIRRSSETPEAAQAAAQTAEILLRFSLGQAVYFAAAIMAAFPKMTPEEMERAADVLYCASAWFKQQAQGNFFPQSDCESAGHDAPVRNWSTDEDARGFYDLVKIFAVLGCDEEYCSFVECWETRRWCCERDCARMKQMNENGQAQMREIFHNSAD